MRSRYDFMKEGVVYDEDGSAYPDPLTFRPGTIKLTSRPEQITLTEHTITKLWKKLHEYYGTTDYDDIILTLNGIPHRNFLKEGMILLLPKIEDIETSYLKRGV